MKTKKNKLLMSKEAKIQAMAERQAHILWNILDNAKCNILTKSKYVDSSLADIVSLLRFYRYIEQADYTSAYKIAFNMDTCTRDNIKVSIYNFAYVKAYT